MAPEPHHQHTHCCAAAGGTMPPFEQWPALLHLIGAVPLPAAAATSPVPCVATSCTVRRCCCRRRAELRQRPGACCAPAPHEWCHPWGESLCLPGRQHWASAAPPDAGAHHAPPAGTSVPPLSLAHLPAVLGSSWCWCSSLCGSPPLIGPVGVTEMRGLPSPARTRTSQILV